MSFYSLDQSSKKEITEEEVEQRARNFMVVVDRGLVAVEGGWRLWS